MSATELADLPLVTPDGPIRHSGLVETIWYPEPRGAMGRPWSGSSAVFVSDLQHLMGMPEGTAPLVPARRRRALRSAED